MSSYSDATHSAPVTSPDNVADKVFGADSAVGPKRGLFSIPELQHPQDFLRLAAAAIAECDDLRTSLWADASQTVAMSDLSQARNTLFRLDRISKTVCNVIDAAEMARSVHADPSWRDAAQQVYGVLADYIAQLNSDADLYYVLTQTVTSKLHILNELSDEEIRFATLLQKEFERDGIYLPEHERTLVRSILGHVTELESLFCRNLVTFKRNFQASAIEVHQVLPRQILESIESSDYNDDLVTIPSDAHLLQALLRYSSSSALRQDVHMELNTFVPENLTVLEALVQQRHELAQALQYPSYAHRFLLDKLAQHPTNVHNFLQRLLERTRPCFRQDMNNISRAKQSVEGSSEVMPWDVPYYVGLLKGRHGFDCDNRISPYLTMANCLTGMQQLVQALFGIEMIEEELTLDERWDKIDNYQYSSSKAIGDNGIRRFAFFQSSHVDGSIRSLGTMYLDLYPRPGKYGHAAHFTIRCGCIESGPEDLSPQYQLPIVALVCNIGRGNSSVDNRRGQNQSIRPYLLSHSEAETLFHEFGHALHSLLSRTKFQHMSGTRAAIDFVETPSHLFENFVWDTQFLKLIGKHYETGEVIPDESIKQLKRSRSEFSALDRQNQIVNALFDQQLFGVPTHSNIAGKLDSTSMFAKLNRDNGIPYVQGTHWHTQNGHLISYGAGYYSYLYSQVFAADIWKTLFDDNSLSRSSGERLWQSMLRHGGAKDPHLMLTELLGHESKMN